MARCWRCQRYVSALVSDPMFNDYAPNNGVCVNCGAERARIRNIYDATASGFPVPLIPLGELGH